MPQTDRPESGRRGKGCDHNRSDASPSSRQLDRDPPTPCPNPPDPGTGVVNGKLPRRGSHIPRGLLPGTLDPERVWMVQTNGGHDLYESLSFRPTLLAFFDHFLKDAHNGFEKRPHLEVWMGTVSSGRPEHELYGAAHPSWILHRDSIKVDVRPFELTVA